MDLVKGILMKIRNEIKFILNDRSISLIDFEVEQTLLDFLRLDQQMIGTKEGCAEGDCGACTVLIGRLTNGILKYESVNSCIRFLASLDGCHVVSIEYLSGKNENLHPVQKAMVEYHGSQCGFCTPGFVMSLYALWMENPTPSKRDVEIAVQGNLCRCTGYEPIIKAALSINKFGKPVFDYLNIERKNISSKLTDLQDKKCVVIGKNDNEAILPATIDDLAAMLKSRPNATIVAGATDVGLWVTKSLRSISPALFIGNLAELKKIEIKDDILEFGAGVTYSEIQSWLSKFFPFLENYWERIAGWQVRNMGTIGGNIANGSPIGDTPPVLIALKSEIVLRKGNKIRVLPLEKYFIDYGKQNLQQSEFILSVRVPLPVSNQLNSAYKISKRREDDISTLAAGISMVVEDGLIKDCRICFGGMAATPKRASITEDSLQGKLWCNDTFNKAVKMLDEDFSPLSDWRATKKYRMIVARNLLHRFFLEHDLNTAQPIQLLSS